MAMTADGKIASTNRKVTTFGSRSDHQRLLELRAKADAILPVPARSTLNPTPVGPRAKQNRAGASHRHGSGQVNAQHTIFRTPAPRSSC